MSVRAARKPRALIIGPTPPPYHGMSIYTRQLLESPVLRDAYDLVHLDTADRRPMENMGRFELTNVVLGLRHAARLAWLVARHRPDVVYVEVSQNTWAYVRDSVFIVVGRVLGGHVVTHLHGSELRAFYERSTMGVRWLVRWTSRRLAGAAVLGEGLRGIYAGLVPEERVHTVPNGVEDPFPGGPAREPKPATEPLMVTYLGMLYERKGILDLIDAAARVRAARRPVRFRFVGEWFSDADRAAAEARVARHGLGDIVEFPGRVDGDAKRRLLEATDILAFPSVQSEGLPLVLLEAMSAGVPVVSTETGAVRDAVRDGRTGWVVPRGDVAALADAIARLVDDDEERERMGREARAVFEAEFTEERCARRLVEFFDAARGIER